MIKRKVNLEGRHNSISDLLGMLDHHFFFPWGSEIIHASYTSGNKRRSILEFHRDVVTKDPETYLVTQHPDISVIEYDSGEYLIVFNEERFDVSLLDDVLSNVDDKIEEARRAFSNLINAEAS